MQTANQTKLVFKGASAFGQLAEKMKQGGLHLFSEVTINQNDAPYVHGDNTQAQITKQFYWSKQRQMIVVVSYMESSYSNTRQWNVSLHLGFHRSWDMLEELAQDGKVENIPLFSSSNDKFAPKGFRCGGGSYGGSNRLVTAEFHLAEWKETDAINIELFASDLIGIKNLVEKYLQALPFAELWVYSFPPSYSFPGCEKKFWDRFDKRNLRSLVTRPYGSKGLER